jgi:23S rRNA pseudouridine1911/1915/1917 synthase
VGPALEILYEDNHCLAIAKPAGRLSTHFQGSDEPLDREVKRHLKAKYRKPGRVFLGIVHRLDRPVSGVLLFARTSKAAARLAEQFRQGEIVKVYWAIVEGALASSPGTLKNWLLNDQQQRRVRVVGSETPGARQAALKYAPLATAPGNTWVEIRPGTGRKHQIRVQMAHAGHPVVGDRRYGSTSDFGKAIALHARSLIFQHPVRGEPITITANLPAVWYHRFGALIGDSRRE